MEVVIYGMWRCGQYVFEEISKCRTANVHVIGWIDNHADAKTFYGLPVMNEKQFVCSGKTIDAIIVTILDAKSSQNVILSLLEKGYKAIYVVNYINFRGKLPILDEKGDLSIYVKMYEKIVPVFGRIQYPVVTHCNLNCRGCGSFSNISEPGFVTSEEFERDIVTMKSKIRNMSRFTFYGGEALLNPDLDNMIVVFKKLYPNVPVDIFSNGLLIAKIPEKLKEVILEYGVRFAITQYPPTIKMLPQIIEFLDNASIEYILEPPVEKFMRVFTRKEQDKENVYNKCILINDCKLFKEGRLYPCPQICFLHEKKSYLDLEFEDEERDGCSFDLYESTQSDWEILLRLRKPFSLCRFCMLDNYKFAWSTGKAHISDWIDA